MKLTCEPIEIPEFQKRKLSIVVETEKELKLLFVLFGYNDTIPKTLFNSDVLSTFQEMKQLEVLMTKLHKALDLAS